MSGFVFTTCNKGYYTEQSVTLPCLPAAHFTVYEYLGVGYDSMLAYMCPS